MTDIPAAYWLMRLRRPCLSLFALVGAVFLLAPWAFAGISNPNDPYFTAHDQWALTSINAPDAWCVGTGKGILVADIDSGADFSHPDLAGKLVPGVAFLNGNGQPSGSGPAAVTDDNGHGTMTTGIIVANTNNRVGIASVAPDAKALVLKVLDAQGNGNDADVSGAIHWAVDHGAKVVNLSIGADVPLTGDMSSMTSAIDYAYTHGVAVALAAGNNSLPLTDYQFSQIANEALVVGALAPNGSVAYYSTSGVGVNIYAPGGDDTYGNNAHGLIISTHTNHGYAIAEGTSFAAPHAAGVLALLMSKGMSGTQARQRILDTADSSSGTPKLDAARAMGASAGCASSTNRGTAAAPPLPVAQRVGPTPPRVSANSAKTAAPPTTAPAHATVSVSTPDTATPSSAPVAVSPMHHGDVTRARSWALILGAVVAVVAAAALSLTDVVRR